MRRWGERLAAGDPLPAILAEAGRNAGDPALEEVFGQVRRAVVAGRPLSLALALHPRVFPDLLVGFTRAGEEGGCLEVVWGWFADHVATRADLERSTWYALVVLFVALAVVFALLVLVLPQFQEVFADMRIELPLPTRFLLAVSDWVSRLWWLAVPLGLGTPVLVWRTRRTRLGRACWQRLADRLPWLGRFARLSAVARLAALLLLLLECRVPVVQAVGLAAAAAGNRLVDEAAPRLRRLVAAGRPLSHALRESGILSDRGTAERLARAEDEGRLDWGLAELARDAATEAGRALRLATMLFEPLVIVGLGLLIGGIVLSVFLPMGHLGCAM
ncbi:MAG: hypothetical protein GX442_02085 [Candidatus Riflebacteria bacterium]|nr:hypothetical protein [Candidatus Riflebacteria bacterium]